MFVFSGFVFLVIGLAIGQETSIIPETADTTLFPSSTTELPISTSLSTDPSETSSRSTAEIISSTTAPSTTPKAPSSTPEAPSTTQVPLPTKPPGPKEGSWKVTDRNVTCIRANLAVEFRLPDQNGSIFLSPNASSSRSNCNLSNTTQALVLEYDNYILTFEFEKDSTSTYVRNVSFIYTSIRTGVFYNDTKLFLVKNGNSYLCKSLDSIHLGNATMQVFKIQIQAFGSADETGFGKIEECELDDIVSDVVPIAVSCALAGLIVIALIVYLIGRRRVRQKGYTSV